MIVAVVTDLIFGTKITGTGKAMGKPVTVARTVARLEEVLAGAPAGEAVTVIVDLNSSGVDGVEAVRAAKGKGPPPPRVVAFLSHVDVELAKAAREAGADEVMARSGFVERLPGLIESAG